MTENEKLTPLSAKAAFGPLPPDIKSEKKKAAPLKSKETFLIVSCAVVAAVVAGLLIRTQLMPSATVAPSSTAVVIQLEQRIASLERQAQTFETKISDLDTRIDHTAGQTPAQIFDRGQGAQPPTVEVSPAQSQQSAEVTAHLQSDVVALSAAMSALQNEVKMSGNAAAATEAETEAKLATAISFVQLRETASQGRGFKQDLALFESASGNAKDLRPAINEMEPFAAAGAPTVDALREEFRALEVPTENAVEKATAVDWEQRLLADLKGLVSIRPLHGNPNVDVFSQSEGALEEGNVGAALDALKELPPEALTVLKTWRQRAEAREHIDHALRTLASRFVAPEDLSKTASPGDPGSPADAVSDHENHTQAAP